MPGDACLFILPATKRQQGISGVSSNMVAVKMKRWVLQGRTDIILDNPIAQQKAVPMVIIMCDGNSQDFTELLNDCIPFVEENYRVKKDRSHRA